MSRCLTMHTRSRIAIWPLAHVNLSASLLERDLTHHQLHKLDATWVLRFEILDGREIRNCALNAVVHGNRLDAHKLVHVRCRCRVGHYENRCVQLKADVEGFLV